MASASMPTPVTAQPISTARARYIGHVLGQAEDAGPHHGAEHQRSEGPGARSCSLSWRSLAQPAGQRLDVFRADAAAAADEVCPGSAPALGPAQIIQRPQIAADLVQTVIGSRLLGLGREGVGIGAEANVGAPLRRQRRRPP